MHIPVLDELLVLLPLHIHQYFNGLADVVKHFHAVDLVESTPLIVQVVVAEVRYLTNQKGKLPLHLI